ncbi:hypothetical protein HMPREF0742_02678 [Rothia aeria F0184]|uniref:Uncharacterized protein n=1 Tax=Rothia aeria F0184 TaxID=888019 RepID=U7UYQ8_9MICC|nr:hypothetical protein HMPREF0742_02678 [Rothia aeria F0184]
MPLRTARHTRFLLLKISSIVASQRFLHCYKHKLYAPCAHSARTTLPVVHVRIREPPGPPCAWQAAGRAALSERG